MKFIALVLALPFTFLTPAFADEETRSAVKAVQEQMKSPQFAEEAAKQSPEAAQVRKQIKQIAGSEQNEQEIYNLAADILGNFQNMSPEELQKALAEAKSNPEAFGSKLTPAQRQKLKEISEKLPAAQKKKP